jgi:hypothetical protein
LGIPSGNNVKNKQMKEKLLFIIRGVTLLFIIALVLSGITAFPVETELKILISILGISPDVPADSYTGIQGWLASVYEGLRQTNEYYPFLAYGYDWLAFAHIVIAIAFIGLYLKPVRNKWLIYFGMIACAGIIPLAFICGYVREIPFYWQLIDCSFGILGFIPLYILHIYVNRLEKLIDYRPSEY